MHLLILPDQLNGMLIELTEIGVCIPAHRAEFTVEFHIHRTEGLLIAAPAAIIPAAVENPTLKVVLQKLWLFG